jgi:hypothetical protein
MEFGLKASMMANGNSFLDQAIKRHLAFVDKHEYDRFG